MAAGSIDALRQWAWRAYKRHETKAHQLLYLFFEVTRRCNLACIHCGSDCSHETSMPEMTLATWISIMDYVKAHWNPFIVLTGGEPLVRSDLHELTAARHPELILDYAQSWHLVEWIRDHRAFYRQRGLDISFSCEGYLPFALDRQVLPAPFFCRAGINIASILSDGTITGCNNNGARYYQGNVAADDFHTVWGNGFSDYRDRSWMRIGPCADCVQWRDCQGGSIHLRDKTADGPQFCYMQSPPVSL